MFLDSQLRSMDFPSYVLVSSGVGRNSLKLRYVSFRHELVFKYMGEFACRNSVGVKLKTPFAVHPTAEDVNPQKCLDV